MKNYVTTGLVAGLLCCAGDVSAQSGVARSPKIDPETCRAAGQIASSERDVDARLHAMRVLLTCPVVAGEVLPRLWERTDNTRDDLQLLFVLSHRYRSEPVHRAALRVFRDMTESGERRVAALAVLGAFVLPDLGLHLDFQPLSGMEPLEWDNVWTFGNEEYGESPMSPDREAAIVALIREAASGDPDGKVRSSAWWLDQQLRFRQSAQ